MLYAYLTFTCSSFFAKSARVGGLKYGAKRKLKSMYGICIRALCSISGMVSLRNARVAVFVAGCISGPHVRHLPAWGNYTYQSVSFYNTR